MYSTKPAPNYRTTVQVHGPSNTVNGFLGANTMAYLGKTPGQFYSLLPQDSRQSGSGLLRQKLEEVVVNLAPTITMRDSWCKFQNGTQFRKTLRYAGPSEGWVFDVPGEYAPSGEQTLEVKGLVQGQGSGGAQVLINGTMWYSNYEPKECLDQAEFNKNAVILAKEAVNVFWAQESATITPEMAWDILNNQTIFNNIINGIVQNQLIPLINGTVNATGSTAGQAQNFMKYWKISV
jgi:hypothetical protein